jgi:hypothetical protein
MTLCGKTASNLPLLVSVRAFALPAALFHLTCEGFLSAARRVPL